MNNIFYIKQSNVHNVLLFIFLNVIVLSNLLTGVNTLHLMRLRKTMRNGILGRPHHISSSLFSANQLFDLVQPSVCQCVVCK